MIRRDPRSRFDKEVARRGQFKKRWFMRHLANWEPLMRELRGQRATILELGAFEGLATCYMLWRLPDARITCVDTFTGIDTPAVQSGGAELEQRFDANVALVDAARVEKIVAPTAEALPKLIADSKRYHLIYVDASHRALDVIVDAALAWRLLRPGGLIVFDDYHYAFEDPEERPTEAIDAFIRLVAGQVAVVPIGKQVCLRRVS